MYFSVSKCFSYCEQNVAEHRKRSGLGQDAAVLYGKIYRSNMAHALCRSFVLAREGGRFVVDQRGTAPAYNPGGVYGTFAVLLLAVIYVDGLMKACATQTGRHQRTSGWQRNRTSGNACHSRGRRGRRGGGLAHMVVAWLLLER